VQRGALLLPLQFFVFSGLLEPVALRAPPFKLGRAGSYACGLVSPFREPVVLSSYIVEVLFKRGRRRVSSQLPHARRVLAVVIRR
jgi:hypothetical protein